MQEEKLRKALLAVTALVVIGFFMAGLYLIPIINQIAEPFLNVVFCPSDANNGFLLSAPTSADSCKELSSSSRQNKQLCGYYSTEKIMTCQQLVDEFSKRSLDCLTYSLTNKTEYAKGADKINELCATLTKKAQTVIPQTR